jgi:hypothetical protein
MPASAVGGLARTTDWLVRSASQPRLLGRFEWWRRLWPDVADEELAELEPALDAAAEGFVELAPVLAVWVTVVPVGVLVDCVVVVPVGPPGGPEPAPHAHAAPVPPAKVRTAAITASGFA